MVGSDKMTKILLVGSEREFLEYLKGLINWEHNGYQIVDLCHSGEAAVLGYQYYLPQLVMIDLNTRDKSGIEIAKEILAFQKYVEIIFLSDIESFNSLRAALEIGVRNFLIKKELDEKFLIRKLEEIRNQLGYQSSLQKIRIENDIAYYIALPHGNIAEDLNRRYRKNYNLLLVEQDYYLPVFSDVFQVRCDEVEDGIIRNLCYQFSSNIMVVLKIDTYRHLLICLSEEMEDTSIDFCYKLKNRLSMETESSFSVFILCEHMRMEESIKTYQDTKKIVNQKYFYNISTVMNYLLYKEKKTHSEEFISEKLEQYIENGEFDTIIQYIDKCFIEVVNNMDYETFSAVIKEFIEVLKIRNKRLVDLKTGAIFVVYSEEDEENWYLAIDAIQWLKRKYRRLQMIMGNNRLVDYSKEVSLAIKYMYNNYKKPELSIEDIADYVSISASRLSTIFKEEMGVTMLHYLTSYRILKAKELLADKEIKISDIYLHIGYTTPQYFSRVFKKESHMTPKEYKRSKLQRDYAGEVKNVDS